MILSVRQAKQGIAPINTIYYRNFNFISNASQLLFSQQCELATFLFLKDILSFTIKTTSSFITIELE